MYIYIFCNVLLTLLTVQCKARFKLELELELYFYLDTVNLSDKIIILLQSIITVTIYFNLYKHDLKFKSKIEKNKEILLYIDAVCVLSIQRKKLRQRAKGSLLYLITALSAKDAYSAPFSKVNMGLNFCFFWKSSILHVQH